MQMAVARWITKPIANALRETQLPPMEAAGDVGQLP
jgi:hypothetical protein